MEVAPLLADGDQVPRYIAEGTYFHVTRALPYNIYPPLASGVTLEIGAAHNPFFAFFENSRTYHVTTPKGALQYPAMAFLRGVKDGELNCPLLPQIAFETAQHFQLLARELIMEEVRKTVAADAPSRQRCIWLADSKEEADFWFRRLGNAGLIVELSVSGTAHRADASHLLAESEPLSVTYAKARAYWRGEASAQPEFETLFQGKAKVVNLISSS